MLVVIKFIVFQQRQSLVNNVPNPINRLSHTILVDAVISQKLAALLK